MIKYTVKKTVVLPIVLTFFFALTTIILVGCKRKEKPEDTQQAVESRQTRLDSDSQKTDTSGKIGLRILYAGLPNTDRAKDFVDFLTRHFQQVETTDYNTFTGSHTSDFDVAIIDHDGADTRAPRLRISRQYARATVTVGVPGAFLCSNLSLKTGYL
jgi:hypothetical protein